MNDPEIVTSEERLLVGMKSTVNLRTANSNELWKNFMSRKNEIPHPTNLNLYSVQEYPIGFRGMPDEEFVKWAAVEVDNFEALPETMDQLKIPAGRYAVFKHHGPAKDFHKTISHIFGSWLPNSDFAMDNRPQFELMDENYLGPNHPDAVEDVWIPIKKK